jgi:hypothetical protein
MDFKNVNKSQFQFGKLKKYDKNYFCHVVYDDLEPLCVKTPVLIASSGVVKRKGRAFVDMEVPSDSDNFVKFVRGMDQICIDRASKNCESWFQKVIGKEDIEGAYQSIIAYESPTTLHMVLTNLDEVYNHRGEKIPSVRVKAGSSIRGEMEFIGIWVTSNWIGGYWELKNIELIETEVKQQPRRSIRDSSRPSARVSDDEVNKFKEKYKKIYPDEDEDEDYDEEPMVERESIKNKPSSRSSARPSAKQSSSKNTTSSIRRNNDSDDSDDSDEDDYYKKTSKPSKPSKSNKRRYSSSSEDYYSDDSDDYHSNKSKAYKSKKTVSAPKKTSKYSKKSKYTDSESDYSSYEDDRKREYCDDEYSEDDNKASYETSYGDEEDPIDFNKLVSSKRQYTDDEDSVEEVKRPSSRKVDNKDDIKVKLNHL